MHYGLLIRHGKNQFTIWLVEEVVTFEVRGFAIGWDYAFGLLITLPFEIVAVGITIDFWRDDINIGVWIAVFLTVLSAVQIFGVRGYGEGA